MTARDAVDDGDIFGEFNAMPDPDEPAPVSPDLECTVCQHVSSPHGVPVSAATPGRATGATSPAFARYTRIARPATTDQVIDWTWGIIIPEAQALWTEVDAAVAAQDARPAPELAAYEADIASLTDQRNRVSETADQLRALVAEILGNFGPTGSGHTARVGQVQIRKWRARAGLPAVSSATHGTVKATGSPS